MKKTPRERISRKLQHQQKRERRKRGNTVVYVKRHRQGNQKRQNPTMSRSRTFCRFPASHFSALRHFISLWIPHLQSTDLAYVWGVQSVWGVMVEAESNRNLFYQPEKIHMGNAQTNWLKSNLWARWQNVSLSIRFLGLIYFSFDNPWITFPFP